MRLDREQHSSGGTFQYAADGMARLHARITPVPCSTCNGMGFLEAGTAIDSCATCDGRGAKRIGDVTITRELAERLQRFAERGE